MLSKHRQICVNSVEHLRRRLRAGALGAADVDFGIMPQLLGPSDFVAVLGRDGIAVLLEAELEPLPAPVSCGHCLMVLDWRRWSVLWG